MCKNVTLNKDKYDFTKEINSHSKNISNNLMEKLKMERNILKAKELEPFPENLINACIEGLNEEQFSIVHKYLEFCTLQINKNYS